MLSAVITWNCFIAVTIRNQLRRKQLVVLGEYASIPYSLIDLPLRELTFSLDMLVSRRVDCKNPCFNNIGFYCSKAFTYLFSCVPPAFLLRPFIFLVNALRSWLGRQRGTWGSSATILGLWHAEITISSCLVVIQSGVVLRWKNSTFFFDHM